jgi:D-alanine--D-alanine ligase
MNKNGKHWLVFFITSRYYHEKKNGEIQDLMLEVALICGGPSKECNISLNSVRSVYDHMRNMPDVSANIVFINEDSKKYLIDEKFLYSNTTSDFKFMLHSHGNRIDDAAYLNFLKSNDLVFPIMHGKYGEDGELQKFLEDNEIPFVASPSEACKKMYNKQSAEVNILKANKMATIPKLFLDEKSDLPVEIKTFFHNKKISEVILKPVEGGSSIGVKKGIGIIDTVNKAEELINTYKSIVIEKVCKGKEFTVIILEHNGVPTALIPTEIEIINHYGKPVTGEIFDQRKKYMSTTETHYYCPPRFNEDVVNRIRVEAEFLFSFIKARDFLRIDGWLFENGTIYFSDFNPISGMEQNSFIFQQAARIGFSHSDLLEYILRNACSRYGIDFNPEKKDNEDKQRVNVLLGGLTSERQVSVLSGTNTWLKLINSSKYYPVPYILTLEKKEYCVYEIPYAIALNHTTEEIYTQIKKSGFTKFTLALKKNIVTALEAGNIARCKSVDSKCISFVDFLDMTKQQDADIFICLHGGFGENGALQTLLEQHKIHFNGSGSKASKLCIDKFGTGQHVDSLKIKKLRSCKKKKVNAKQIKEMVGSEKRHWKKFCGYLGGDTIVVKPNNDGCSTGIVVLRSPEDLQTYCELCSDGAGFIPESTFTNQPNTINLPSELGDFIFEEYIETQKLEVKGNKVVTKSKAEWVELTVGVLEKRGIYHSMNPSVTVADNAVLSLEEKFQGGTGINFTPPPENIIKPELVKIIKKNMEITAKECGVKDYCRIDIFANNKTNEIIVIEINSLPGLSPSTVLFQQGAKEEPPLYPMELLEYIISR